MSPAETKPAGSASIDEVIITEELACRQPRTTDLEAENRALHALARQMGNQPGTLLKSLVRIVLDLCGAGTAGVSLLEITPDGDEIYRWTAIAGACEAREGGSTPAGFSPCGICLERGAAQLYAYPGRCFTYYNDVAPPIVEGLVIPLSIDGRPRGTLWILAHDEQRKFDSEDVRVMTSVADFTAAAVRIETAAVNARLYRRAQREIAERRRMEEALRRLKTKAEQQLRVFDTVLSSVRDFIYVFDLSGRFTYANQPLLDLWKKNLQEVIGKNFGELGVSSDLVELHESRLKQVITTRKPLRAENPYSDANGTRHYEHIFAPILDSDGGIEAIAAVSRDITERQRLERQLRHNAFHDGLTGLPNRALFMDRLAHVIVRSLRQGENYALLMLDIDNFKLINDSFGHVAGDQILVEFARFMRRRLRPQDFLARLGGDEFCIVVAEIDSGDAVLQLVGRIQDELKGRPFYVEDLEVYVAVSVGITFENQQHWEADAVVQDADIALYEAKRRGKGGYVVFEKQMRQNSQSYMRLERALQHSIASGSVATKYQPIVELATGRIVGCEALARWYHPAHDQVSPNRFIPLAEGAGIILPLGRLVLETACRELADWLHNHRVQGDFYVGVNLSAQQLTQTSLVDQVVGVLDKYGLHARNLRLEVTESSIIRNGEHAARVISDLQARGIRVCLDDFGVGYSALSYLQRFPVSVLKLDQSFVKGLTEQPTTWAIVQTILDLTRNLGLEAIAEGVERDEHRDALITMGFTRAQGFLFHRPMSSRAMMDVIAAAN